jgi:drug/metabolite transporter (DMT)-like permease
MLLCGAAIAAYSLIDHTAVPHVNPLGWLSLILLGCCTLLAPFALRRPRELREVWRLHRQYIVGAGIASSLGYTLVLYAFRLSKTGYVVAARESSILFAVLIGAYLLREQQARPRLLGGVAIVAGLIMLALAR